MADMMTIAEATEATIAEAIERGIVDERLHAAPIACVRELARRADAMEGNVNDNVTLPTMLKFLASMGIIEQPTTVRAPRTIKQEQPPVSKLDAARGDRFKRFHVA